MKFSLITCSLICLIGIKSYSNEPFVQGSKNPIVYSKDQSENGSVYQYSSGRKFEVQFYFDQIDVMFYAVNENKQRQRLWTEFELGYDTDGEMRWLKNEIKFLLAQYDFDGDGIDELIIALQDNDETGDNGLSINVFKLIRDEWIQIGKFNAPLILGEPIAVINMNHVRVNRNLRGFYYQWTYSNERGLFINTGDY